MFNCISIVIRTLNEQRYLGELLDSISKQDFPTDQAVEVVVVDSGSTDKTIQIAQSYNCQIVHIKKEEFSFGRALNVGCAVARGDCLVFISGHCVPVDTDWLRNLVSPLNKGCSYSYGRQRGRDTTKFSEQQLFDKYFPDQSAIPQVGFFVNNANAAIRADVWKRYRFDEEVTGCEDMALGRLLVEQGHCLGYVAEACVFHIHDEIWTQTKLRYEREAVALCKIMPEVNVTASEAIVYFVVGCLKDLRHARFVGCLFKEFFNIICFRSAQYYGVYRGNRNARDVSGEFKLRYYYPRTRNTNLTRD